MRKLLNLAEKNKKGLNISFFVLIFVIAFGVIAIFLGASVLFFQYLGEGLNQNVMVGQVNLSEAYTNTSGKAIDGFINHADEYGIGILVSMTLALIFAAFILRNQLPKYFIIADIIIIIMGVVVSSYISSMYHTLITSSTGSTLFNVYQNQLNNTSRFILNLPIISGVWGILVMVASNISLKRGDEVNVQGY